jgi:putative flippase GtrA
VTNTLRTSTLGVPYLAANIAAIGVCSLVNFLIGDRWVFLRGA